MKYSALLRGIMPNNPKTRNIHLQSVFENLGFKNVQTVIASGNVIFETESQSLPRLEKKIEQALTAELDFSKLVIVRTGKELQKIIASSVVKKTAKDATRYAFVTFFKSRKPELIMVIEKNAKDTPNVMAKLEKEHGKDITSRTGKTIERILKKMEVQ